MISPKSIVVTVVAGVDRLLLFPLSPLAHLALPLEVLLQVVARLHVGRSEHSRVQPLWNHKSRLPTRGAKRNKFENALQRLGFCTAAL